MKQPPSKPQVNRIAMIFPQPYTPAIYNNLEHEHSHKNSM